MNSIYRMTSRKFIPLLMILILSLTTVGCGSTPAARQPQNQATPAQNTNVSTQTRVADGRYPVQQATFDDVNGEYSLFLLNTPAGTPPLFRTADLQMAALTEEEVSAGQKGYLEVEGGKASLHIPQDFKIEYVHNVVENQTDPQTGQSQPMVVRQESSFWTPFAGAVAGQVAGQVIGNALFRPQYYVPPAYRPGVPLNGFGGYGSSYGQAVSRYQSRYQAPPAAVRNRQTFRTTGGLRSPSSSTSRRPSSSFGNRSTGSGFGASNLRQSERSRANRLERGPSSFGSGRRAPAGFGSRRSSGRRR